MCRNNRNNDMTVETNIRIIGLLALAAANAALPGRLRWREEVARLSPLNRQVFLVHAGFVVLITILLGSMCVLYARELLEKNVAGKGRDYRPRRVLGCAIPGAGCGVYQGGVALQR